MRNIYLENLRGFKMDSVGHSTSCMCEGWNPSSILGDREKQTVEASWQPSLGEKADWCFRERHCVRASRWSFAYPHGHQENQLCAASTAYEQQQALCFLTVYLLRQIDICEISMASLVVDRLVAIIRS